MLLTHLLFVDNVLIFCDGSHQDGAKLDYIISLFILATCMIFNYEKYSFFEAEMTLIEAVDYMNLLQIKDLKLAEGLKYLGFIIKLDDYLRRDWESLIGKIKNRIHLWSNKWLSWGGILIVMKSILESIRLY